MKRNLTELEIPVGLAWMIGDDGCRNHVEFAGAPAIQDVRQAMIRGRDQQHDAAARRAVAHLPVHAEPLGDRREAGLQRSKIDREIGRGEYDTHEEMPGLDIVELLGVENVLPVMCMKRRDGRNDAWTIRAGWRQYVL